MSSRTRHRHVTSLLLVGLFPLLVPHLLVLLVPLVTIMPEVPCVSGYDYAG
jgi:hypothetical protein